MEKKDCERAVDAISDSSKLAGEEIETQSGEGREVRALLM